MHPLNPSRVGADVPTVQVPYDIGVAALQGQLNRAADRAQRSDWRTPVTGIFDAPTMAAITAFQTAAGRPSPSRFDQWSLFADVSEYVANGRLPSPKAKSAPDVDYGGSRRDTDVEYGGSRRDPARPTAPLPGSTTGPGGGFIQMFPTRPDGSVGPSGTRTTGFQSGDHQAKGTEEKSSTGRKILTFLGVTSPLWGTMLYTRYMR